MSNAQVAEPIQSLRLLMMHDAQGKYLIVVSPQLEIQADLLAKATGRKLQPVLPQALQRFFRQPGMRRLAGQRKLFESLPLIVDSHVTDMDLALLETSTGMLIDEELAQQSLSNARRANLGKELSFQLCARESDSEEIADVIYKFTARRLGERLEETLGLPAFSPTAQKLLRLRGDPDAGVDQLLPLISNDPSYAAQAMAWANSPMFAAPGHASSLEDAVVRILGFDLTVNMGLSLIIGKELNLPIKGPKGAVPYWQRALATALLAERLGRKIPVTKRPAMGLIYLSGLLHNFGTLLLGHLFSPQYDQVCSAISLNPHIESWKIERSVMGLDSAQIAAWLFKYWSLPDSIVDAIRWQNQPEQSPDRGTLAMLLRLCGRLLREQGMSDGPVMPLPSEMLDVLGLQFHHIEKVMEDFDLLKEQVQVTVAQLKL